MFFKKSKIISKLQTELIRETEKNTKYIHEIQRRNETVCPKCIHSVEVYEKQKYKRISDPVPYYANSPVHACKLCECVGFEPRPEAVTEKRIEK